MRKVHLFTCLLCMLLITILGVANFAAAQTPTEIDFWHAMSGNNGEQVTALVADFNASHPNIHVTEQNKGNYDETLNAVIQAAGQGEGPNMAQIFDLGTPLAIDSGFFTPVETILSEEQLQQVTDDIMPPLINYFTIGDTLWSLPWNNSTPILYYNKDMFEAAGLDPDSPPATWQELQEDCAAIMEAGVAPYCLSAQIYGWYFEQWMALQGQELANNGNGRADRATETNLTSDAAHAIMQFWKDINDQGYWVYTGVLHDNQGANQIFISKQAAIIIESTGALRTFTTGAEESGFELGTGFFPTNGEVERQGVIIGGASLWVSADNTEEENAAVAEFLMWLEAPEQMARWHQGTGYMPDTLSSQELLESQGYFDENPNQRTAVDQLAAAAVTPATAGAIMGPFPQIRVIVEQAIQSVTAGGDIDEVLTDAKAQADAAIADYNSRLE
jgi:sn-glycerol 3-phosphate transport system substrate-binding protein